MTVQRAELRILLKEMVSIDTRGDVYDWLYKVGYDCDSGYLNETMALINDEDLLHLMIDTLVTSLPKEIK